MNERKLLAGVAIAVVVLLLLSAPAAARDYGPYAAKVVRVIDGDTLEIEVEVWPGLTARSRVRLVGINTPESRGKISDCERDAGKRAADFTRAWVAAPGALAVVVSEQDKYGRPLVRVRRGSEGIEDLGQALIAAGLARAYHGERRGAWC
jgi:endonuclease YncB( thermonuclease family)